MVDRSRGLRPCRVPPVRRDRVARMTKPSIVASLVGAALPVFALLGPIRPQTADLPTLLALFGGALQGHVLARYATPSRWERLWRSQRSFAVLAYGWHPTS